MPLTSVPSVSNPLNSLLIRTSAFQLSTFDFFFPPTSSNTYQTTPPPASVQPRSASFPEIRAALADTSPTPPPRHISLTHGTIPRSAPADQPYPPLPAKSASVSSHFSRTRTASYSEILPASHTAR